MPLRLTVVALAACLWTVGSVVEAAPPAWSIRLAQRKPDPHGTPRPAPDSRDVAVRTSLYVEIETPPENVDDGVDPESVAVRLQAGDGKPVDLLKPGREFVGNARGWLKPKQGSQGADYRMARMLAIYIEPGEPLEPATRYTVLVVARSHTGRELAEAAGRWSFTTETAGEPPALDVALDLAAEPVTWQGKFFSGLCNVTFCTRAAHVGPTYELMTQAHAEHPNAWSYQRDFWMTGMDHRKPFMNILPNVVREKETRRIAAIESSDDATVLRVEDFYGHEQYGIASGRPLSDDYHSGDEVLIADGISSARAKVLAVDDEAQTVRVTTFDTPAEGWKIDYEGPLPVEEDPDAPGLFPPGGCYLSKFLPHGTACYYWGRLDKEFDQIHRTGGRRLMVNFADAAGDLSLDGRNWTTAKDLAQWHGAVREISGHIIDRYGEASLDFTWSVFNEPDLMGHFWRAADWNELQRFYDYTVDGILRAFEERGYDSQGVFVGGLELGGIFGTNLKLKEFLAHCSPRAAAEGALPLNAAFADERLSGQRSRRVEQLCSANGGQGSPCDFVSIHAYNNSEMMAAKLRTAKQTALDIDEEFYRELWINSHECCPDWSLPPDEAAADSYRGNGYFPAWCLDVTGRQLRQAAADPRFGYGESLLTVWPPPSNLSGINAITRVIGVDDDGDGRSDRRVTVPNPVFHVLTLLSDFGDRYWVLPEQHIDGRLVAGFASRDAAGVLRVALYSHDSLDTQTRREAAISVSLHLDGAGSKSAARMTEYRFDKDHNSYFAEIRRLLARDSVDIDSPQQLASIRQALKGDDPAAQVEAIESMLTLRSDGLAQVVSAAVALYEETDDAEVKAAFARVIQSLSDTGGVGEALPAADVERIQQLAALRPTAEATLEAKSDGDLRLTTTVAGNGVNFFVIETAAP